MKRITELLHTARIHLSPQPIRGCARIVTYGGVAVTYADEFTIGYLPDIADTNALLVSGNQICTVFQVRQKKRADRASVSDKIGRVSLQRIFG